MKTIPERGLLSGCCRKLGGGRLRVGGRSDVASKPVITDGLEFGRLAPDVLGHVKTAQDLANLIQSSAKLHLLQTTCRHFSVSVSGECTT